MRNFDLEQQNHLPNESKKVLSTQDVKTNSSMSTTPISSASQSPPSANTNKLAHGQQQHVDLAKASYTRDEMSKAIEILKEKFVQESLNVAQAAEQIKKSQNNNQSQNSRLSSNQPAMSNNTAMVKDIEVLNSKLAELQNEINRLTLLQQKQYSQQHTTAQKLLSSATTTTASSNGANGNVEDRRREQVESNSNQDEDEEEANEDEAANGNLPDSFNSFLILFLHLLFLFNADAFFIAIGNGTAKREKPQLASSKKQQIFIKSNLISVSFLFFFEPN